MCKTLTTQFQLHGWAGRLDGEPHRKGSLIFGAVSGVCVCVVRMNHELVRPRQPRDVVRRSFRKRFLIAARLLLITGSFSLAINLLILTPSLYMMQVYDRVITTGHLETLIFLTAIAALALMVLTTLDSLRSSIMVRVGCWLNDRLGPVFLASSIRAQLQGDTAGAQPLRDLAQVQNFISSQGLTVFLRRAVGRHVRCADLASASFARA